MVFERQIQTFFFDFTPKTWETLEWQELIILSCVLYAALQQEPSYQK